MVTSLITYEQNYIGKYFRGEYKEVNHRILCLMDFRFPHHFETPPWNINNEPSPLLQSDFRYVSTSQLSHVPPHEKTCCSSCTDIYHSDLFSWSRSVSRNPSVRSGRADFQISLGGFRSGCGRTEFEHTKAHLNFPGQDVHRVHFNPRGHPDELWSSEMAPSGGARNERRGKRYTRMVV